MATKKKKRSKITNVNVDAEIEATKRARKAMRKVGMGGVLASDSDYEKMTKTERYRQLVREQTESDQKFYQAINKLTGKKQTKYDKQNEKATQKYARRKRKKV
jgi:hypothetical protein